MSPQWPLTRERGPSAGGQLEEDRAGISPAPDRLVWLGVFAAGPGLTTRTNGAAFVGALVALLGLPMTGDGIALARLQRTMVRRAVRALRGRGGVELLRRVKGSVRMAPILAYTRLCPAAGPPVLRPSRRRAPIRPGSSTDERSVCVGYMHVMPGCGRLRTPAANVDMTG